MTNPGYDRQRFSVYLVDYSGPHLIAGRSIDASAITWVTAGAGASRYAQSTGRSHRQERDCDTAQQCDDSAIASSQRSEVWSGPESD